MEEKEVKPLTKAQRDHLKRLNDELARAQVALNQFVFYLRQEHEADEWWELTNLNVGFERVVVQGLEKTE